MSTELTPDPQVPEEQVAPEAEAEATEDQQPSLPVTKDFLLILNGFGMAWTAYQLYPDPTETPSWARAIETFRSSEAYPMYAEVGQDQFVSDEGPIEVPVEGVGRLARALFVHEAAAISLPSPPTDSDLMRFFEVLHTDPAEVVKGGGVRALLSNSGVSTIEVVSRAPLEASDHHIEPGRATEVKVITEDLADPQALAVRVMADAGCAADRVTDRFTFWF